MNNSDPLTIDAIDKAVLKHSDRLKSAFAQFHVTMPGGAYPERSMSQFYIGALAEALGGGTVIAEVPFPNVDGKISNNHLDAIVFNDTCAILAEFKRSWTPKHWFDLAQDVRRVLRFANSVSPRFRDNRSRTLFGFYGSDGWRSRAANAWKTGDEYRGWKLPHEFLPMRRGSTTVWTRNDDAEATLKTNEDGYYWLWACERVDTQSPST